MEYMDTINYEEVALSRINASLDETDNSHAFFLIGATWRTLHSEGIVETIRVVDHNRKKDKKNKKVWDRLFSLLTERTTEKEKQEAEKIIEQDGIHGVSMKDGNNYCMDCANTFTQGNIYRHILTGKELIDCTSVRAVWHDDLVQYEQYPGEILPVEGVQCENCGCYIETPYSVE